MSSLLKIILAAAKVHEIAHKEIIYKKKSLYQQENLKINLNTCQHFIAGKGFFLM
jgi:hypothetical protein